MRRRSYIQTCGIALAASFAGCSGSSDGESDGDDGGGGQPTETPSPTPSPTPTEAETPETPTATPEPVRPKILKFNLISGWDDYGDVVDNKISSVAAGEEVHVGIRYEIQAHGNSVKDTVQYRVEKADGSYVTQATTSSDELVDDDEIGADGMTGWEWTYAWDSTGWEPGEYVVTVQIRDDISGKVSGEKELHFELTEPEPKVEILSHEWYEEDYDAGVRGEAENVSDETLDYVEVNVVFLDDSGAQIDSNFTNTTDLAPGRRWKFDVGFYGDADAVDDYEISVDWNVYS